MKMMTRPIPLDVLPWLQQRTRDGFLFSMLPLDYFQRWEDDVARQALRYMKRRLGK